MNNESVYCACGAQWHGKWVIKAQETIAAHKARWKALKRGEGAAMRCWSVPHDWFKKRFGCKCETCQTERKAKWKNRKANRVHSANA